MARGHNPASAWLGALAVAVTLAAAQGAGAEGAVRFAPLPLEERGIIYEQFKGLVDYLAEETALAFRWVHHADYADILGEFRAGAIDLAYLGPLPYVILRRDTPHAEPLGCFRDTDGAASYTCSLVAWGADRRMPGGLTGVHVGLTQPYSTCGYLAVSQMLASAGRSLGADGNSFEYAGSHQAAALGVARGRYDVAGVKTAIARRYTHLGLETIATSSRFPGFTLVANTRTLSPDRIRRLRAALLALDPAADEGLRARMEHWGRHIRNGAVPAARCDYTGVEAALAGLPRPVPGTAP